MSDLLPRFEALADDLREHKADTRRHIDRLDRLIDELRHGLSVLGERVDERLGEIRDGITHLTVEALNSQPKWAAESSDRKNTLLLVLAGLLGSALATIGAMAVLLR